MVHAVPCAHVIDSGLPILRVHPCLHPRGISVLMSHQLPCTILGTSQAPSFMAMTGSMVPAQRCPATLLWNPGITLQMRALIIRWACNVWVHAQLC